MMDPVALTQLSQTPCASHLKRIGLYPHHGFILILSALHSKNSSGIGEYLDLLPLISWAKQVGFDFIQLLPLSDSGEDNSPYNPISTFALNPVFLSLHALDHAQSDSSLKEELELLKKYPRKKEVQYAKVRESKLSFLKHYFELYGPYEMKKKSFSSFKSKNSWVLDYALFCCLLEHHQTSCWQNWPKSHQSPTWQQKKALYKKYEKKMSFHIFLQYLCYKQMHQVKVHAEKHKLFLFGDLPFLVSRHSCDAWSNPSLFLNHFSVGSPPDRLTPLGQDWNFPAYNWKELKQTGYSWWKKRLKVAEKLYHIYRLDHIIGFYRTWNIPHGKKGCDGAFDPPDPRLWLEHGRGFLKALLKASSLLPIGEDLVIPQSILDSMRDLGVCGTRILTWQRTGAGGLDFVPYPLYTVASITHLASHDTDTLAQWWLKYPKTAKEFALWRGLEYSKKLSRENRKALLYDSHHTSSLFHANLLNEYLALFPALVHKKAKQERINVPATPSSKNWKYRFVPSLEELTSHKELKRDLKKIIR